jgi:hypothetical protein
VADRPAGGLQPGSAGSYAVGEPLHRGKLGYLPIDA